MQLIMKSSGRNDGKAFTLGDTVNVKNEKEAAVLIERNLATPAEEKKEPKGGK